MAKSLKEHRAAAGLTQQDLGEKSGVHPVQISDYETGKANPSLRNARRIAGVLGVPLDEISFPNPQVQVA